MNESIKKCPMCAETIPLQAVTCEYCGAQFEVTITGYCQNCHQIREADENSCCGVCNGEIMDRRIESKLIEEPIKETTPTHQPAIRKTNRNIMLWVILAGVLIIASIGGFLLLGRNDPPAAPVLIDTPTSTATFALPPAAAPAVLQTLAPTHTPRLTPMPTTDRRILNTANQHLYLYVQERKSWHEARDYCASQSGHLVTIQASSENRFVYELATQNHNVGTWLGATDESQEGTWVWVTGEPWNYWNWNQDRAAPQPDNKFAGVSKENADFLAFEDDRTWMDWGDDVWYFVCEWEP